jgi:ankyrin repeat protein
MKKCETISGENNYVSSSLKDELFEILTSIAATEADIFRKHETLFGNTGLHTAAQFKMFDFLIEMIDLGFAKDFDRENKAGTSVRAFLTKGVGESDNDSLKILLRKLETADLEEDAEGYTRRLKIPMHKAIAERKFQRLCWFIILGGSWSSKNADGITVLENFASHFDNSNLLFLKWILTAADEYNETLLHTAVRLNREDLFNFLIENEVSVSERRNDNGMTPLHYTAKFNRKKFAEILVEKKKVDVDTLDFELQTPLHIAAEYNSDGCAEIFLKFGAKVEAKNEFGQNPLNLASIHNSLKCLKALIAGNANVNSTDNSGVTPLMVCSEHGHIDCAKQLIAHNAIIGEKKNYIGLKAIDFAARHNNRNILQLFIDDVHTTNDLGETLLFEAIFGNSIESLTFLIENGVDCNIASKYGTTPLHKAVYTGFTKGAILLVENNADINAKDCINDTPLHSAIAKNYKDLAKALIEHGADVNALNDKSLTPLMLAIGKNQSELVSQMIEKGANLEIAGESGQTALNMAIFYGILDCVRILIENGADVNARSSNGRTPVHLASAIATPDCLKLLIAANADTTIVDAEGLTALDWVGRLGKNSTKEDKNICIQILNEANCQA